MASFGSLPAASANQASNRANGSVIASALPAFRVWLNSFPFLDYRRNQRRGTAVLPYGRALVGWSVANQVLPNLFKSVWAELVEAPPFWSNATMPFWAYMLHCRAGRFYVGHTDNLDRRIAEHQSGAIKGFTSALLPVELVWSTELPDRISALEMERQIKGWSRAKKLALIRGDWAEICHLAKSKNGPSTSSGRTDF